MNGLTTAAWLKVLQNSFTSPKWKAVFLFCLSWLNQSSSAAKAAAVVCWPELQPLSVKEDSRLIIFS